MKRLQHAMLLAAAMTLTLACRSLRVETVEHTLHDTLYASHSKYDSVFILQDRLIDRASDTIVIRDRSVEHRYHLLHDTVRVVRIDSIPYVREVEVVRRERYTPWYARLLSLIGIGALALLSGWIVRRKTRGI